jgi:septal ring factor EnvC (AmiA/AmiB activator)
MAKCGLVSRTTYIDEREAQTNLAQENGQKLAKFVRETELLQKQLEDLGHQVQSLLREIARCDDPTLVNADKPTSSLWSQKILTR